MTKELLKNQLENFVNKITKKSIGHNKYDCPLPHCNSGKGKHGTGAFTIADDGQHWKCFSCGKSGDIFDLIGYLNGFEEKDYKSSYAKACEFFHIENKKNPFLQAVSEKPKEKKEKKGEPQEYIASLIKVAAQFIEKTDYHRGISLETLKRFRVGYLADYKHINARSNVEPTPRLIIPINDFSYIARDTRSNITEQEKKYQKIKSGKIDIFNKAELQTADKPIFIVEGELDALSIIDVGGAAIGLGSISMIDKFISLIKEHKPVQPLIIALDDEKGIQAKVKKIQDALELLNIEYDILDNFKGCKDANELLMQDRNELQTLVEHYNTDFTDIVAKRKKKEIDEYKLSSASNLIDGFTNYLQQLRPCIKTGFSKFDELLDGGLYEGLYIIGAISSLGKTTLTLQIADNIAQSGTDVLIFSLEMSKEELIAKSISRLSHLIAEREHIEKRYQKSLRGVLTLYKRFEIDVQQEQLITACIDEYRQYADKIYIKEGMGNLGVEHIREAVQRHVEMTGNAPVVFVDYLQILAPFDPKSTDKQNTDKAVLELKRISRDFKTPVFAVSSLNRANYSTSISMEAFKESGAIEYSSDVLIGLQIEGIGELKANQVREFVREAKTKPVRSIQAIVLKNRNGKTGDCSFTYNTLFNCFKEDNGSAALSDIETFFKIQNAMKKDQADLRELREKEKKEKKSKDGCTIVEFN